MARAAFPLVVALALLVDISSPCPGALVPAASADHHAAMGHDCGKGHVARLMPRCECGCTGEAPNASGLGPAHPAVLALAPVLLAPPAVRCKVAKSAPAARTAVRAIDHVPRFLG